jgi:hypothetical protein
VKVGAPALSLARGGCDLWRRRLHGEEKEEDEARQM